MTSQGTYMRRMISVAPCLGLLLVLSLPLAAQAQATPETAVGQALPSGMMGRASGPMTWGGTLSRSLMPAPPAGAPAAAAAELVETPHPVIDSPEDGELLPQAPVVELFTSQGCASCPTADAYFGDLAGRGDLIALALHVDYWDYIGWADGFARADYTKRQKSYARATGSKVIYTPQIVIGGTRFIPGNDTEGVALDISAALTEAPVLRLRLLSEGARRVVSAMPAPGLGEVMVQLVRYTPEETVTIERGENAGRTVTYHNIVTDWTVLGRWDGREKLRLDLDLQGAEPAVLLFQSAGYGPIVGAARLP